MELLPVQTPKQFGVNRLSSFSGPKPPKAKVGKQLLCALGSAALVATRSAKIILSGECLELSDEGGNVEYRLLGGNQSPSEEFTKGLATFYALDDEQRRTLADWFLSSETYDIYASELADLITKSSLLPEQFVAAAGAIRNLLFNWYARSLELADVERDLVLMGYDPHSVSKVSQFLNRLAPIKEQVWAEMRIQSERFVGLPTLDDANIVWSARPVFGASAAYFRENDAFSNIYDKLIDTIYLATLEISASDASGIRRHLSVQLDEHNFGLLRKAMDRAANQLESLKTRDKQLPRLRKSGKEIKDAS